MNMYILSEAQFDQIIKALDDARFALDTCQHVELDLTDPKQTIALPATKPAVRTTAVRQSQSKTRKSSRKGRRNILNETKVVTIKSRLEAGESAAKIARDYGVAANVIYSIKYGLTWKHVSIQQDATPASVNV